MEFLLNYLLMSFYFSESHLSSISWSWQWPILIWHTLLPFSLHLTWVSTILSPSPLTWCHCITWCIWFLHIFCTVPQTPLQKCIFPSQKAYVCPTHWDFMSKRMFTIGSLFPPWCFHKNNDRDDLGSLSIHSINIYWALWVGRNNWIYIYIIFSHFHINDRKLSTQFLNIIFSRYVMS